MPEITPHISLKKPLASESADISVMNDNMDTIDSALGDLSGVPTTAKDTAGAITELFEALENADIPDATLTTKGKVQLSSATNSTAEDRAATPKAVKDAVDAVAGASGSLNMHIADYVRHPGYAVATGAANVYAVALNPALTGYIDGMALAVKINVDNTGGPTINVNSLGARSIKKANGGSVAAGQLKAGSIYTLRYNSATLFFILQGEGGEYGTAAAAQVLTGYTIGTEGGLVEGAIFNRGAMTLTPGAADVAIPAGYHNGSGKVSAVANLSASTIKVGETVGGVAGAFTSDATATTNDIASGKTAYVNGVKVTGNAATYADVSLSAPEIKYISTTTYAKAKQVTVNVTGDVVVSFQMYTQINAGYYGLAKVYINGVAVGIERSSVNSGGQKITFSQQFSVKAGDTIELWTYSSYTQASIYTFVSDFKVGPAPIVVKTAPYNGVVDLN